MAVPRFHHPNVAAGPATLSKRESHHACTVLRCRVGDRVLLFDGDGREAVATLTQVRGSAATVNIESVTEYPFDQWIRLTLAVAMPRKSRQPFLIEKCTELGVWSIWPMVSKRSVVKPGGDQTQRWLRTAIEAVKQSERRWLPRIETPQSFRATLERIDDFDAAIVTDARESFASIAEVLRERAAASRVLVWIGPEGGLSPDEVASAIDAGAVGARIGSHVLRVETAAITVAALAAVLQRSI